MIHFTIEELLKNNQSWVAEKLASEPDYFNQLAAEQKTTLFIRWLFR